jgi:hypothetical protein
MIHDIVTNANESIKMKIFSFIKTNDPFLDTIITTILLTFMSYFVKVLYDLNLSFNFENMKIGNYEVNDSHIYHPGIKYKIPIEVFYNLEGDVNKYIELKHIITKEKTSKMFIPKNNFDININLIKDGDFYKPNAGLLSMLSMHNLESKIREFFPSTA